MISHDVLGVLYDADPMTVGELAAEVTGHINTVATVIRTLEEVQFLRRCEGRFSLTSSGREFVASEVFGD